MIRTRKAPARFLSAMLCFVLMLGLLPMTAFAEGTREEVDTIKATAIINVPSYGAPTNYPAFTVTEGSPAYIAAMMTHWEKKTPGQENGIMFPLGIRLQREHGGFLSKSA